ncbi:MAG: 1,4-dihydroxy-2-naphthoate polyprenyltransferase [Candidatus Sedimenticola endophacoides]
MRDNLRKWLLAIRPKTLPLSVAPVLTGTVLAHAGGGALSIPVALATLAAAMLIQIGTNLHNDAADFERGTDTPRRLGPRRATAEGWFSAARVKRAALLAFLLALLTGSYLAWVGGTPILVLGLLSLGAGYAYTGGPRPIAYSAGGELFVFLFFGLAAVAGSFYLQRGEVHSAALAAGAALGLFAAAVLLVNNYRDLETDTQAGRLTLAHRLGRANSRRLYAVLLLLPFTLPPALEPAPGGGWLVLLALPPALSLVRRFASSPLDAGFNRILADTARLQLLYAALLCLGVGPG